MPITVTAPAGVLTPEGEAAVLPRLTQALLEASGAPSSAFFASIVGGTVNVLPAERVYAGGANRPVVMVELKLPNIGLASLDERRVFIELATAVIADLSVTGHDPSNTWVNILNAADGAWGIDGRAWTGDELVAASMASASASSAPASVPASASSTSAASVPASVPSASRVAS